MKILKTVATAFLLVEGKAGALTESRKMSLSVGKGERKTGANHGCKGGESGPIP